MTSVKPDKMLRYDVKMLNFDFFPTQFSYLFELKDLVDKICTIY